MKAVGYIFDHPDSEIRKAVWSFPNSSAGGPDGLRPRHLKDLIGKSPENLGRHSERSQTDRAHLSEAGVGTIGVPGTPTAEMPFYPFPKGVADNRQ